MSALRTILFGLEPEEGTVLMKNMATWQTQQFLVTAQQLVTCRAISPHFLFVRFKFFSSEKLHFIVIKNVINFCTIHK